VNDSFHPDADAGTALREPKHRTSETESGDVLWIDASRSLDRQTLAENALAQLEETIARRTAVVAVVGLGYVGLPLVLAAAQAGFPILGVDANEELVDELRAGRSHIVDVADDDLAVLDRPMFTSDPTFLRGARVVIIAVPTPLRDGAPDLGPIRTACAAVAASLRPGQLVILESTTYPGTTQEVVRPILETSGLRAGIDFALAYSPERIDPGNSRSFAETPKIVAGLGPRDTELAKLFYETLVDRVVLTRSPREAEMAKLIENTFRQVNIALVNEMATLARDLDVDIWSALDAAATKPFGYLPFWPGPGVGGHCIAIDPSYLSWRVRQRAGFGMDFIDHANAVNNRMPGYVAGRVGDALNDHGKAVRGSRVLIIGLAYKPGVNDVRESPALAVLGKLRQAGADLRYHDPFVPTFEHHGHPMQSVELTPETLAAQDCVVILTAHPGIDWSAVVHDARLVFDAQGVTRSLADTTVVRL
jgi:nucleotide sugar dehydrogenase